MDRLQLNNIPVTPGQSVADALKEYARDCLALTYDLGYDEDDDLRLDIGGAREYVKRQGYQSRISSFDNLFSVRESNTL